MKFTKKSLGQNFLIDKNVIRKIINSTKIKHISERLGVPITEIGKITNSKELILLDYEGNKMELGSGYSHF